MIRVSLEVFNWASREKRVTNLDSVVFIQNSTNEMPTDLDSVFLVIQHTVENLEELDDSSSDTQPSVL